MSRREPAPVPPRMLSAEQAAAYLGYATTGVLANIPVKPVQMAATGPGSQPKYDRHSLDAWLDEISGLTSPPAAPNAPAANDASEKAEAAYANWKASRGPR